MPRARDLGLEPDESVLAELAASFPKRFDRGAALPGAPPLPDTMRSPGAMGGLSRGVLGETRMTSVGRYKRWQQHADSVGFPVAGMAMRLGITQRRLLVWHPTFFRGRPQFLAGSVPLDRIIQASAARAVTSARVYLLFKDGSLVTLETMFLGRARRFVDQLLAARDGRPA
jgi:hypothetical protein